jgi:DNA modification methylase
MFGRLGADANHKNGTICFMRPGQILCGDALSLIPTLRSRSVNLCLTSPPYANQRRDHYPSVAEKDYPAWMTMVMAALHPKLTKDGSVLIVIRSHVRDGFVSDYVLRTRLALREDGWKENEELIWLKPDAPPLGSKQRPRRTWESILWFSKTPKPYINLTANGGFSDRIGLGGSRRLRNDDTIATKRPSELKMGHARTSDVFTAHISAIENGIRHPAMFPVALCEKLIRTFTKKGDLCCLDPFAGSGTVLLAAQRLNRQFVGFDLNPKYVKIAQDRLAKDSAEVGGHALAPGERVQLRPEFPQRPSVRRSFLLSKGLNASDVRVFNLVLDRTVDSQGLAAVSLSLSDVADLTGLSRRTVIRAIDRLRDAEFLSTARDDELHYHDGAMVGLHPSLLAPLIGDNKHSKVTNAPRSNRIRKLDGTGRVVEIPMHTKKEKAG